MQDTILVVNDFGSHKGCRYKYQPECYVAAPLVGAITATVNAGVWPLVRFDLLQRFCRGAG